MENGAASGNSPLDNDELMVENTSVTQEGGAGGHLEWANEEEKKEINNN